MAVIAIVTVTAASLVWAQDTRAPDAPRAVSAGSLDGLTAEIRVLRVAIEDASRRRAQTEALGVYLSAQQSRLVQTASRLDAAAANARAASARVTELGQMVAST
jgi:hypothetical protein